MVTEKESRHQGTRPLERPTIRLCGGERVQSSQKTPDFGAKFDSDEKTCRRVALPFDNWHAALWVLGVCCLAPLFETQKFATAEQFLSRLSQKKGAMLLAVFLGTILLRVALLPLLPVPAPAIHDEFSYLVQADIFAHGRLAYPPHPMAQYLETFYVFFQPVYASMFPPAQAMFLAVGQWLGNPWIGVLLSCGTMAAALLWMLQAWLPPRWAMLGTCIFALRVASYGYWINSYWGGAVAAIGGALVLGALPRLQKEPQVRHALLMGAGIFLLANSRPLEGMIFCLPVAAVMVAWLWRRAKQGDSSPIGSVYAPLALSLAALAAFTFYYNWRITGNAFELPHVRFNKEFMSVRLFLWQKPLPAKEFSNPQFRELFSIWAFEQFNGTAETIRHITWQKIVDFYHYFLGVFLAIPLLAVPWMVKDRRTKLLLIQFLFCAAGLFSVVWFLPHYAAPMFVGFVALWVQCFRHLRQWKPLGYALGVRLSRVILLAALVSLTVCAHEIIAERYEHQICDKWQPHNLDRERITRELNAIPGQHLVLVRYTEDHNIHMEWVYNRADIDASKIVWARELPDMDLIPLFKYYAGRKVWLVNADDEPIRVVPYEPVATAQIPDANH